MGFVHVGGGGGGGAGGGGCNVSLRFMGHPKYGHKMSTGTEIHSEKERGENGEGEEKH
jgi:hypothetical protein